MTALAVNYDPNVTPVDTADYKVAAGQRIFKGSPVFLDVSDTGDFAVTNDGTTITLATGDKFVGIAKEEVNNTDGSDGDLFVVCHQVGAVRLPISDTLVLTNETTKEVDVFINNVTDNSTATTTSDTGNSQVTIGKIIRVTGVNEALVRLTGISTLAANGA